LNKYELSEDLKNYNSHYFNGSFEIITGTVIEDGFLNPAEDLTSDITPFYIDDDADSGNVQVWLIDDENKKYCCLLQAPETYLSVNDEITFINMNIKEREYFFKLYNHATDASFFLTDVDDLFEIEYKIYLENNKLEKFLYTTPIIYDFAVNSKMGKKETTRQETVKLEILDLLIKITDFADISDGKERTYRSAPQAAVFKK
jgi:hypothetical protein